MEIKKNDKFTVTIEDMGEDGAGIGRVDGYIWFVKDALIGDTIEASAMKMKKNYGFARLVRVITPAKGRVEAKCPVARACGGCQLQELDYKEQLKFKEKKVYNHLKRIGGMENLFLPEEAEQAAGVPDAVVMEPIIGMEDPWRYRNKAQYPIGREKDGKPTAGFFAGRTHSLIPVPELDCLLGCAENKDYLAAVLKFMEDFGVEPYDEANHKGLVRHVLLRKGFAAASYRLLGLISYLTAGEKETRAWTIKVGTKAPQAAGKIHTDFERGFIKAEVVNYKDLLDCGSYNGAKEKGLVRMEGKDYVMKDGDVVLFRFNV